MKIMEKNNPESGATYAQRTKGIFRLVLAGFGLFLCFSLILALIMRFASPDQYVTAADIKQEFNIVESEGGVYSGSMVESIYSGQGKFQHLGGGSYTGSFTDSQRSGEGTFTWPNGDSYSGTWSQDQMVEGVYQFADGMSYTGTFSESHFNNGTFSLGASCEAKGYIEFQAELTDGIVADLDFMRNDGLDYDGAVAGTALIKYVTGNQYSGKVSAGIRYGQGEFKWMNEGNIVASYIGDWKDGVMSGVGKYYFSADAYPYIEGTFVNGRPDGSATYHKASGNTFTTTWSDGKCTKVTES